MGYRELQLKVREGERLITTSKYGRLRPQAFKFVWYTYHDGNLQPREFLAGVLLLKQRFIQTCDTEFLSGQYSSWCLLITVNIIHPPTW